VLVRYFFLCDFPFFGERKSAISQHNLLVKNAAQQEIPNTPQPRMQGKV